jgi:hypothetical protein
MRTMNQSALLPHKHVRFCESLLALAGHVRVLLNEPRTVDEIWSILDGGTSGWPTKPTFTYVLLSVDILFALGQVAPADDGRLHSVPA